MKFWLFLPMFAAVGLLSSCASHDQSQAQLPTAPNPYTDAERPTPGSGPVANTWPLRFNDNGTDFTIFEPQYDSWDGHQLSGRCAVAVQGPHEPEASYGVFSFTAITLVDKDSGMATLADLKVTSADFPTAQDKKQRQDYLAALVRNFPKHAPAVTLNRLQSNLTVPPAPKRDHLNNTPPAVIIASRPAVLVYVDGAPAWRAVAGTSLQRAINTRMLLLKDANGRYYVHLFDGYLQAASLTGPWTVAGEPPAGAAIAEKQGTDSGTIDLMAGAPAPDTQKAPSLRDGPAPDVFVATTPTELIQFQGAPQFAAIPGTDLLYASNTSGDVFKCLTDQQNYILISGRWYRAASLNGPWRFVPGNKLPRGFVNIPDSSPKENVKASVPGTQQAEEALIANSIPQSVAVPRTNVLAAPQFDGAMQLAPIDGTPLHYVVNSPTPIIEQDPQSWYACQDGVWYTSASASGPWAVAAAVPPVIYTIPPDSPLHYLTYVQVYGADTNAVYEGYTPGYMGTEVADDGTVVYGTGYDYSPWVGDVWYGPPVTYGWGFDDCWSPWWGWGFGCGFGWGFAWGWGGYYPPRPWWGGYHHWHDHDGDAWHHGAWANTGANIYHHDAHFAGGVNHGSGNGFGQAYNSRTGMLQAGQAARVRNVEGAAWAHHGAGWNNSLAARNYAGWNSTYIAPRFGDMNRGYQTYSRGSWHGGNYWQANPNGHVSAALPGAAYQRGSSPAMAAPHGGGFFGGGFHGGGGGFHGGGGGGHR